MSAVEIRPVDPERDAEAIWSVRRQPGVLDGVLTVPSERLATRRAGLDSLGPDDHMLVAVRDGAVIGCAGLHVQAGRRRHAADFGIMVHADHHGTGVGTALTEALLDLGDRWLGLRRIELVVFCANEGARRFYERFGFEVEGRLRAYATSTGGLEDAWVMGRVRQAS